MPNIKCIRYHSAWQPCDGTTRKKQEAGERQDVRGTVARISPRKQAASTNLTSMPQEGTKSSERSEQDMQRDKGTHDHMRETGLTVVTRRSLRALADALRQPASSVLLVRGLELTLALLGKKRETIRKRTNETIRKTNTKRFANEQTKRFTKQTNKHETIRKTNEQTRNDSQKNKRNDSQNKRTNKTKTRTFILSCNQINFVVRMELPDPFCDTNDTTRLNTNLILLIQVKLQDHAKIHFVIRIP